MKYFNFVIFILILNFIEILCWGYNHVVTPNELAENKNATVEYFDNGLKLHTMKIGIRLKNSQHDEVEIFSLISNKNNLSLKYLKNEHKVIFHINVDIQNKTKIWEVQYPNVNLEVGGWHYLVYRFGKLYFKLWIDCELRRTTISDLKTLLNMNENLLSIFGRNISLRHGDNDDIEYNQKIEFFDHLTLGYSFRDQYTCDGVFNLTNPQIRINNNEIEGTFYPLDQFQDVLLKYNTPGVYYELKKSTLRDVSDFFEDGIDKDHSFEMTYRIKEFTLSNYSCNLISLKSNTESEISLALNGKRNILKLYGSNSINGKLKRFSTEYWAEQIYDNGWHTIKYMLKDGTLTLWIDDEIMEDFLGFKYMKLKYTGYDTQYLWFDTALLISEQQSGSCKEPVLHITHMKYYGNAVTTNNTELSLIPEETKEEGYFNSFLRAVGRIWSN